ncbi:putrescine/spermidine ABC transporter permease [Sinorhizobium fredii USDA 205]|uniref:ABC transporter permease subunit n=1 Tax=Rhizobium fredii TaxID=380 RepID=A0A844A405_RHIFR|nr:ABC transporter permease [Sinorhizobium fredii]ASY72574.1 Spermidine Putrescine ABC transporter permease component potC [Sinorhizobium fredii CCBAU 83666]AWM28682.1 Spermidine Putrescine ABC transporter permease component potC [Sinorhizobium fredii CCBAU 25509]KSV85730.1 putrescine/spermidine ABC transporter permease [Sinorhizobium fredii USDA 205]MQX06961.1 ABC transporter permease subunit [Sinorhizobium fredii]GEC32839.1 spermidine/putrescine ABC transporter permease [Sinorhizobium fredii
MTRWVLGTFTLLVYAMVYLPIALVVITSFNQDTITTLPIEHLDTRWYAELFQDTKTLQSLWTSLQVGIVSTTVATTLGLLSALAIVRHNFRGKSLFMLLTVMPMLAPGIIMGVSLLLFARYIGFQTGFVAVLLGHVLLSLPYCTFILISSLARFDRSLEEAARGLGAGELSVLWRVTLPGIMPGIIGAALFAFTISIGEFVVSFFLTSAGTTTLPIRIYSIVKVGITPEINAVSTLILVATVLLSATALSLTWSKRN